MDKPKFLQQVRTKAFVCSKKDYKKPPNPPYGWQSSRKIVRYENQIPDDVYVVIGTVNLQEGYTERDYEYGDGFVRQRTVQVYIIARSIGRRRYALAEDLEAVEETR